MDFFALSWASLLLGFIHGFDTDHVIDVTDFVSQDPRPLQAALFGARFGIGHTATVFTLGLTVYLVKSSVPAPLEGLFQLFSGIVLIILGVWGIYRRFFRQKKDHDHAGHNSTVNYLVGRTKLDNAIFSFGPVITGVMTGMVGTAGLMLFGPVTAAPTVWWLAMFILLYGAGVILAMSSYGFLASKFFGSRLLTGRKNRVAQVVTAIPGFFSIGLGTLWAYRVVIGFKEIMGVVKML